MELLGPRCFRGTRGALQQMYVQEIIALGVTVHEYLARPQQIQREEHRQCPVCPDGHRLWLHG